MPLLLQDTIFLWTNTVAMQAVLRDVGMSPAAEFEQPTGQGITVLGPPRSAVGALAGSPLPRRFIGL